MKMFISALLLLLATSCSDNVLSAVQPPQGAEQQKDITAKKIADSSSWHYFLQHLPEQPGPVVDYKGNPVPYQQKHFAIINYDVGSRDLQQCADALMRLRAEYLFNQKRANEIGFHFTGGQYYRFTDYCSGKKPVPYGSDVRFANGPVQAATHQSLRKYLDIVYTYAGTISLAAELQAAGAFGIGTVVITPGSPGHCFIIADEAVDANGEKLYKLVEGYTPAQTIYVLANLTDPALGYWHRLRQGPIATASYEFTKYKLGKFE